MLDNVILRRRTTIYTGMQLSGDVPGGIPQNDDWPAVFFKNWGKTPAFILETCIVLRFSMDAPSFKVPIQRRFPQAAIRHWPPGNAVVPGEKPFRLEEPDQSVRACHQLAASNRLIAVHALDSWLLGR
jgi:hypothetical protein